MREKHFLQSRPQMLACDLFAVVNLLTLF